MAEPLIDSAPAEIKNLLHSTVTEDATLVTGNLHPGPAAATVTT